jgi:hypothetical protein
MKNTLIKYLIGLLIITVSGCAGSRMQTITNNCQPKPYSLYVTEFELPQINSGDYAFTNTDFNNIRLSIIDNMKTNKCYNSVIDEILLPDIPNKNKDDITLKIKFSRINVLFTSLYSESTIEAQIIITNSQKEIIKSDNILISKKSGFSVMDAKNKSIKSFTEEVFMRVNE